jgi:hypothetical protein
VIGRDSRVTKIDMLRAAQTPEEAASILKDGVIATLTGRDLADDRVDVILFNDNTGAILHYHDGVATCVAIHDMLLDFHPGIGNKLIEVEALN